MILVTGATGNVGSSVASALRHRDAEHRLFVRDPSKAAAMLGEDANLVVGDFDDKESLRRALEDATTLFIATPTSPDQPKFERNIVDAASGAGVEKIVKLGAARAKVGARLSFHDWQGQTEEHLERSGIPAVLIKPNFYMTNLLAVAEQVRSQGMLFAPAGEARVAMIDPRDVAEVAAIALTTPGNEGESYEVTGAEAITYIEVAETLSKVIGRPVTFVDLPDQAAHRGLIESGAPPWLADGLVSLFGLVREGFGQTPTDTVLKLTGNEPRTFTEFARDHAASFRK